MFEKRGKKQYMASDWGWNTLGATELYLKGMDAIAAVNPCAPPRLIEIVPSRRFQERNRKVPAWNWGWITPGAVPDGHARHCCRQPLCAAPIAQPF